MLLIHQRINVQTQGVLTCLGFIQTCSWLPQTSFHGMVHKAPEPLLPETIVTSKFIKLPLPLIPILLAQSQDWSVLQNAHTFSKQRQESEPQLSVLQGLIGCSSSSISLSGPLTPLLKRCQLLAPLQLSMVAIQHISTPHRLWTVELRLLEKIIPTQLLRSTGQLLSVDFHNKAAS